MVWACGINGREQKAKKNGNMIGEKKNQRKTNKAYVDDIEKRVKKNGTRVTEIEEDYRQQEKLKEMNRGGPGSKW